MASIPKVNGGHPIPANPKPILKLGAPIPHTDPAAAQRIWEMMKTFLQETPLTPGLIEVIPNCGIVADVYLGEDNTHHMMVISQKEGQVVPRLAWERKVVCDQYPDSSARRQYLNDIRQYLTYWKKHDISSCQKDFNTLYLDLGTKV